MDSRFFSTYKDKSKMWAFFRIFRNSNKETKLKEAATKIYYSIVEQARLPVFYSELSVEDSIDKRFEMIVLHMFIVLNALKNFGGKEEIGKISQMLFDIMFDDMEASLREQGIGDMGIPRRIKGMINKFYTRVISYEKSITSKSIHNAINENIYDGTKEKYKDSEIIGRYVVEQIDNISSQEAQDLMIGAIFWSPPNT